MSQIVSLSVQGDIAVLTVDRPPVNAINAEVRAGILEGLKAAEADPAVKAVILACAGRTFLSGADLAELRSEVPEPAYHLVLKALDGASKPVVAALFGFVQGGGLELSMACHYRVAASAARIGMPEINLGILPGAGGTQLLPRLVGAAPALTLMVEGRPIDAARAKELGLIDAVAEDVAEGALALARALIEKGEGPRRTSVRKPDTAGFDEAAIQQLLEKNARALKGRTTQHELVRAVQAAVDTSFDEGLLFEKQISDASLKSAEGQALIHMFFAEREAGRIPGLAPEVKALPIRKAAVIGAGTMGGGIAMSLVDAGIPVTLIEAKQENLDRGLGVIRSNYEATVKRGRLTPEALEQRMGLITGALDMSAASDVDVVIEAVFEDMALKKSVLSQLDKVLPAHAILASNTSSLSLNELASATSRPDKVVGLHFFSPANVMRLLEIVRGDKTSSETLVTALDLAKTLRKIGVVVGDGFGFVGNRMMLDGEFREAELMLMEGIEPQRIDAVAEEFGFAMGPNRVNDMAGVDIGTKVRLELAKQEPREAPYHVVSDALTGLGRLGQKTGAGVYRYVPGDRNPHPDPEVDALVRKLAAQYSVGPRQNTDQEIEERLVLSLINVGAQILEEGIAYRASDIDVIWTSGYGFPRRRGGPMHYADRLGLPHVLERIRHYHDLLGDYWRPAPILERLVKEGRTFAAWDAERSQG